MLLVIIATFPSHTNTKDVSRENVVHSGKSLLLSVCRQHAWFHLKILLRGKTEEVVYVNLSVLYKPLPFHPSSLQRNTTHNCYHRLQNSRLVAVLFF